MDIPPFPSTRAIALHDKLLLDQLFHALQPRISELTFANLFLFRHAHSYKLTRVHDSLIVLGKGYGGDDYFLPPYGRNVDAILDVLFSEGFALYGADEQFIEFFVKNCPGIAYLEDRDSFDYLYLRHDLATLPGNRYHKKKNRVNYFTKRHDFAVDLFSEKYQEGALELLEEWGRARSGFDSISLEPELAAATEGIIKAGELGLEGVVVTIEGRVRAYALGEKLNEDTSVCHFEKADPFIDGLYQVVDQVFNQQCFADCTYVNREQDLGEPSLRQSKLSYHPIELVKKYRCRKNHCE